MTEYQKRLIKEWKGVNLMLTEDNTKNISFRRFKKSRSRFFKDLIIIKNTYEKGVFRTALECPNYAWFMINEMRRNRRNK